MRLNSQNSQRVHTATQKPPTPNLISAGKTLTNFNLDSLARTKTANFNNDSEMRKTKHLVDKISGKFNIDKRYLNNQSRMQEEYDEGEVERPKTTVHVPEVFVSTRPQTKLDKYIELVLKNVANVD